MGRVKILYCGYRDWAKYIYTYASYMSAAEWDFISTTDELKQKNCNEYDLLFFVGWSEIISDEIVNNNTCICLHPSPLPKYRGGSPIQHQIINGETESAVTLFVMNSELDAGDIVCQSPFSLTGDLEDVLHRIRETGIQLIQDTVTQYIDTGILKTFPQDHMQATIYKRRKPSESEITFEELMNSTAKEIHNKVRCLQDPYPNAYVRLQSGEKLFLYKTKL